MAQPPPPYVQQVQQHSYSQGYAPGYGAPPPQAYYPPPQPMYQAPAPQMMQQSSSNVVVVNSGMPQHTVVVQQRQGVNHVLHFIISLFFWPWVIVWIILCITEGC